jgi:hypothetical protein
MPHRWPKKEALGLRYEASSSSAQHRYCSSSSSSSSSSSRRRRRRKRRSDMHSQQGCEQTDPVRAAVLHRHAA